MNARARRLLAALLSLMVFGFPCHHGHHHGHVKVLHCDKVACQ